MNAWHWFDSVVMLHDEKFPTSVPDYLATPAICSCGKLIIKLFKELNYWYEIKDIHTGCEVEGAHIPNETDTLFFRLDLGMPGVPDGHSTVRKDGPP